MCFRSRLFPQQNQFCRIRGEASRLAAQGPEGELPFRACVEGRRHSGGAAGGGRGGGGAAAGE